MAHTVERFLGWRGHPPQELFSPRQWHTGERSLGQIALCTDAIGQGVTKALEVLLHEMVHLRNDQLDGGKRCHGSPPTGGK